MESKVLTLSLLLDNQLLSSHGSLRYTLNDLLGIEPVLFTSPDSQYVCVLGAINLISADVS